MESNEPMNFARVWFAVLTSLCYSYIAGKLTTKGPLRLLAVIPVVGLFLLLPLHLTCLHFVGFTSFFISWLANFKLLLFAFDKGPLASQKSSLSSFLAVACLPIKIRRRPSQPKNEGKPVIHYAIKGLIMVMVVKAYKYSDHVSPTVLWILYCFHVYLTLEIMLAIIAIVVRTTLGIEVEPQFNEPYLSTSLQDLWGHRWNLTVNSILRPAVYDPLLRISATIMGRQAAMLMAVIGTFGVSAVMHELMFYYLGRTRPTWEVACFFLLHGVTVALEIVVKNMWGGLTNRRVPSIISGSFTAVYFFATALWLFVPPLLRFNVIGRALEEYAALFAYVNNFVRATRQTIFLPASFCIPWWNTTNRS